MRAAGSGGTRDDMAGFTVARREGPRGYFPFRLRPPLGAGVGASAGGPRETLAVKDPPTPAR